MLKIERVFKQYEKTKTCIVNNETFGISLGYFFDEDDIFEHERIPLDLSYYGYDLEHASMKDKITIVIMLQLLAWIYRKVSNIPEYSNIRYQAFKTKSKRMVNFIHGLTQAGKTAISTMISILFSISFGCIIFVSVKNKDGDSSIQQFLKKLSSSNLHADETPNMSMPLEIIKSILHEFESEIDEYENRFPTGNICTFYLHFLIFFLELLDHVRDAHYNIGQLVDKISIVSKSNISKYISSKTQKTTKNKKNNTSNIVKIQPTPLIVMLLTNHAFSKTIQKFSDFFFDEKLSNFIINNNKFMRFIWIADEADETIITGTRIEKPCEKSFFNTQIGLRNDEKTFFEHCSMVICVSATNIATMMSAKKSPENTDIKNFKFVEPLGTNSVLTVGNDYVGYKTQNIRQICINPLNDYYYSNDSLNYTRFFKYQLNDIDGMNLERINRKISNPRRKIQVRYKSILINTAQSRRRNQTQENISKNIFNSLQQISLEEQHFPRVNRFKYVVFSYNGTTKKTKTRKTKNADNIDEETIVSSTLYSNSRTILSKFCKLPHQIQYVDDNQTVGSVTFELPTLSDIYSRIFQNISTRNEKRFKWIITDVSGNMASRGTTFKDSEHIYPLTDLYYETSAFDKKNMKHYEATLEEIGRLCSKDWCMMPRTLHLRKIKNNDDFDFIHSALSSYDFFYKAFKFHQNSNILRFTPLRLDELIQQYSQFLLSQQQLGMINPEEQEALSWYFSNYVTINNELTRKNITNKCKHRLDDVCEKESPKHIRLDDNDRNEEPVQNNNIQIPSVQFQEAFERDLVMLANEANEPRFANDANPLESALSQFVTSIGSNDATWKTLARHLIHQVNRQYVVKNLQEWTMYDQTKSFIQKNSFFRNLGYFRQGESNTWRAETSNGQILIKNGNSFKLSWHV